MFFSKSTYALAAVALVQAVAAANNAFIQPATGEVLKAGTPYTIKWTPDTGKSVTITLRKGSSKNLDTLKDIASSVANSGSLAWTPPKTLEKGADYAFQIKSDVSDEPNYTGLFSIDSDVAPGSSSKSSTVSSSSSTTSASSTSTKSSASTLTTTTASITSSSNSTSTTSSTLSTRTSSASGSGATSVPTGNVIPSSGATGLNSPVALVLMIAGAIMYLN